MILYHTSAWRFKMWS